MVKLYVLALSAATASAFAPASPLATTRCRPIFRFFRVFSEWSSGVDPGSGAAYWYNEVTGESRWADEGDAGGQGQAAGYAQQGQGDGQQSSYMQATYDSPDPEEDGHLFFQAGDTIQVTQQGEPGGYWEGALNGQVGWFPSNYCVPADAQRSQHALEAAATMSNQYPRLSTQVKSTQPTFKTTDEYEQWLVQQESELFVMFM